jgi:hypothetical protein
MNNDGTLPSHDATRIVLRSRFDLAWRRPTAVRVRPLLGHDRLI